MDGPSLLLIKFQSIGLPIHPTLLQTLIKACDETVTPSLTIPLEQSLLFLQQTSTIPPLESIFKRILSLYITLPWSNQSQHHQFQQIEYQQNQPLSFQKQTLPTSSLFYSNAFVYFQTIIDPATFSCTLCKLPIPASNHSGYTIPLSSLLQNTDITVNLRQMDLSNPLLTLNQHASQIAQSLSTSSTSTSTLPVPLLPTAYFNYLLSTIHFSKYPPQLQQFLHLNPLSKLYSTPSTSPSQLDIPFCTCCIPFSTLLHSKPAQNQFIEFLNTQQLYIPGAFIFEALEVTQLTTNPIASINTTSNNSTNSIGIPYFNNATNINNANKVKEMNLLLSDAVLGLPALSLTNSLNDLVPSKNLTYKTPYTSLPNPETVRSTNSNNNPTLPQNALVPDILFNINQAIHPLFKFFENITTEDHQEQLSETISVHSLLDEDNVEQNAQNALNFSPNDPLFLNKQMVLCRNLSIINGVCKLHAGAVLNVQTVAGLNDFLEKKTHNTPIIPTSTASTHTGGVAGVTTGKNLYKRLNTNTAANATNTTNTTNTAHTTTNSSNNIVHTSVDFASTFNSTMNTPTSSHIATDALNPLNITNDQYLDDDQNNYMHDDEFENICTNVDIDDQNQQNKRPIDDITLTNIDTNANTNANTNTNTFTNHKVDSMNSMTFFESPSPHKNKSSLYTKKANNTIPLNHNQPLNDDINYNMNQNLKIFDQESTEAPLDNNVTNSTASLFKNYTNTLSLSSATNSSHNIQNIQNIQTSQILQNDPISFDSVQTRQQQHHQQLHQQLKQPTQSTQQQYSPSQSRDHPKQENIPINELQPIITPLQHPNPPQFLTQLYSHHFLHHFPHKPTLENVLSQLSPIFPPPQQLPAPSHQHQRQPKHRERTSSLHQLYTSTIRPSNLHTIFKLFHLSQGHIPTMHQMLLEMQHFSHYLPHNEQITSSFLNHNHSHNHNQTASFDNNLTNSITFDNNIGTGLLSVDTLQRCFNHNDFISQVSLNLPHSPSISSLSSLSSHIPPTSQPQTPLDYLASDLYFNYYPGKLIFDSHIPLSASQKDVRSTTHPTVTQLHPPQTPHIPQAQQTQSLIFLISFNSLVALSRSMKLTIPSLTNHNELLSISDFSFTFLATKFNSFYMSPRPLTFPPPPLTSVPLSSSSQFLTTQEGQGYHTFSTIQQFTQAFLTQSVLIGPQLNTSSAILQSKNPSSHTNIKQGSLFLNETSQIHDLTLLIQLHPQWIRSLIDIEYHPDYSLLHSTYNTIHSEEQLAEKHHIFQQNAAKRRSRFTTYLKSLQIPPPQASQQQQPSTAALHEVAFNQCYPSPIGVITTNNIDTMTPSVFTLNNNLNTHRDGVQNNSSNFNAITQPPSPLSPPPSPLFGLLIFPYHINTPQCSTYPQTSTIPTLPQWLLSTKHTIPTLPRHLEMSNILIPSTTTSTVTTSTCSNSSSSGGGGNADQLVNLGDYFHSNQMNRTSLFYPSSLSPITTPVITTISTTPAALSASSPLPTAPNQIISDQLKHFASHAANFQLLPYFIPLVSQSILNELGLM